MKKRWSYLFTLTVSLMLSGCVAERTNQGNTNVASPLPSATVSPSPADNKASSTQSLTLPVLDAFFADESFSGTLKTRLQLTDEQITKLKDLARSETAKLDEENAGKDEQEYSTAQAAAAENRTWRRRSWSPSATSARRVPQRRPQLRRARRLRTGPRAAPPERHSRGDRGTRRRQFP
jgi:hypothetical protein